MKVRISIRKFFALGSSRTGVLGLTTAANLVIRTGSSVLLTRILRPYDFGIVGIITAVFFTLTMITDLGFEAYLVRHRDTEDQHFRDVIWTIHAKRGAALFISIAAASPVIAWGFGKPVVALPLAVASLSFFFNGLASLSLITALRRDKARELSLLELGLQLCQTGAGVLLAFWWRNVWSIIAVIVMQSGLRTFLSYRLFENSSQRPAHDIRISREFFAFSRIVLMSSALSLIIGQSDKLVLGRLLTLDEFGLYGIALTIASAPATFADSYVRRVVFPSYARTWRLTPSELPSLFYSIRRWPSVLYALGCGGLVGSATILIAILYDARYSGASAFVSFLMIGTALRLPNLAAAELMAAMNYMTGTLIVNVVRVVWLAFAIPIAYLSFGTIGVVASVGLMEVPAMLCCWILLRRDGMLRLREEVAYLGLVLAGAVVGVLIAAEGLRLFPYL